MNEDDSKIFYLLDEFNEYLNPIKSKNSDYTNYVKNANKILNNKLFSKAKIIIENQDYELLDEISINGYLEIKRSQVKSKDKYASGLKKYINFLEEYLSNYLIDNEDIVSDCSDNEITEIIEPNIDFDFNTKYTFDKDTLFEIFKLRLITQNRFNKSGLYFPISFLKQYFYKTNDKSYFDNIISEQLENINYLTNNQNKKLNAINELKIADNGNVIINNDILQSTCSTSKKKVIMNVDSVSKLTLDHVKPMDSILKEYINDDLELLKISKEIKKGLRKPVTYNKLRKRGTILSNKEEFLETIDKLKLKQEFEDICNQMQFVLMQADHNNIKRAK